MHVHEMENQQSDEEEVVSSDTDDDAKKKKLLKKSTLPVGFDGKPMPLWLFNLLGLGKQFKCEICGNAVYWGE